MHDDTRERILKAGAELIHRKGFQGTGLTEILAAAGTPKGSFYHYFPSKEAFGLAVLDHFEAGLGDMTRDIMEQPGQSAVSRLEALLARFTDFADARGFALGCPVGKLTQEMSEVSEAFRARFASRPTPMTGLFTALIEQGQASGEFDPALDPGEAAAFLANAWQGAVMRMKVTRSPAPLAQFERSALRFLAAKAT